MAAMPTVAAASRSSSEADREAGCAADSAAGSAVACGEPGVGSSAATNRMPGLPPQQLSPLIVFFFIVYNQ